MSKEFHVRITMDPKALNDADVMDKPICADFVGYSFENNPFNIAAASGSLVKELWHMIDLNKNIRRTGFSVNYVFNGVVNKFNTKGSDSFKMRTRVDFAFSIASLMVKSLDLHFHKKCNSQSKHSPEVLLFLETLGFTKYSNSETKYILDAMELRRKQNNKKFSVAKRNLLDQNDPTRITKREAAKIDVHNQKQTSKPTSVKPSGDLEYYIELFGDPWVPQKMKSLPIRK
jgi:hypothetical protein